MWSRGEVSFDEIAEYADSLQGVWNLDFRQFTTAAGAGACRYATDGRALIYREHYQAVIGVRGALGGEAICFMLTNDSGRSGKWDGGGWPNASIAYGRSDREVAAMMPGGTVNHAAVVSLDVFQNEFECLAGRSVEKLFPNDEVFLGINPEAGKILEMEWLDMLETPRSQRNLTRGIIESLVRACDNPVAGRCGSLKPSKALFRRAMDLIDGADGLMTSADLALMLGVSLRSLELAFKACAGMPPVRYLHLHRLNHVHELLLKAEPSEVSVSTVALEHGFMQLGRFSGEYRRLFGELPSATLRKTWRRPGFRLPVPG